MRNISRRLQKLEARLTDSSGSALLKRRGVVGIRPGAESVIEVGAAESDVSALNRRAKQSPSCTMPFGSGVNHERIDFIGKPSRTTGIEEDDAALRSVLL